MNKSLAVVNNVQDDPDYLTTIGKTQPEITMTIITSNSNEVAGTIDVVSDSKDAFKNYDIEFLKECA